MINKNKRYTTEFVESAVKLALSSVSICGTAKDLGIPESTLHTWVRKDKKTGQVAITTHNGVINNVNVADVLDENFELKKRVARLEQEKAILKKAATYFATELG